MALSNVITPTSSSFTTFLETRWAPRLFLDATEDMSIGSKFASNADLEVDKLGNLLYVRRIATKTTNKLAASSTTSLDITSITLENDVEVGTAVNPAFYYTAAFVNKNVEARMMAYPAYEKGIRTQFTRSLAEQIDADCGVLGASLTYSVSDTNIGASLIRSALGTLRTNAKREYGPGLGVLRIHPAQQANLWGIPEAANADIRSDEGGNVTGVFVKLWGADVDVTGSIYTSGGNRYNLAFVKNGNVLVYNQEPTLQAPQPNGIGTLIAGFADAGMATITQEFSVAIITA